MNMQGINCVNFIEIGQEVIEIQGVENGELAAPVNNTLVCTRISWPLTHDCVS